jgi:hypothetical protein
MDRHMAIGALALGAALLAAPDAFARERRKEVDRLELTRPAGGPDGDAQGVVRIERARGGDKTVLRLTHLDPRTVYEVRDASTDELLGQVRTNRRGKATFNLSRNLAKAAESEGGDAAGDVEDVQIYDADSGECVLEGGVVTDPCEGLLFGYADYTNDAGDYASVFMESAPGFDSESFSFTFFASPDAERSAYYDFTRMTLLGDELPLGVESVSELAGRDFEVRGPDGAVLFDDVLPELEEQECIVIDDPEKPEGDDDWRDEWSGDWGDPWSDDWSGDWGDDWSYGDGWNADGGITKHGVRDDDGGDDGNDDGDGGTVSEFTLWIEGEDGELHEAGAFREYVFDFPVECPYEPGEDPIFIGIIIVPLDGSFDLAAFLDALFGGGWDAGGDDSPSGGDDLWEGLLNSFR